MNRSPSCSVQLQRAMSYSLSKLREKGGGRGRGGEEGEGRAIWQCVTHYLCLAGCSHSFVDIRKPKLRKHVCRRSFYEVACLTVGLRCIVLPDNLFLTDIKWPHSTCYAKPLRAIVACNNNNTHAQHMLRQATRDCGL